MNDTNIPKSLILYPNDWDDYKLIDFGNGKKLEQFGKYLFIRPEAQAMSSPNLQSSYWDKANGIFIPSHGEEGGKWKLSSKMPERWLISYDGLTFNAMPTPFRHLGFFPEQAIHWKWCANLIKKRQFKHKPRILNLFAYSGIASLHAAKAGGEVTHVDASKKAISLAFDNRKDSKLNDFPIRYITEDAKAFVKREIRRGNTYDGIILDPPKYGRGPNGEKWLIENDLQPLLLLLEQLLSKDALFMVLTSYAIRASHLSLFNSIKSVLKNYQGHFSSGELAVRENKNGRILSCAIFARWEKMV